MATLSSSYFSLHSIPFSSSTLSTTFSSPSLAFNFDPRRSTLILVSLKKAWIKSKNRRVRSIVNAVEGITEQQEPSTSEQIPIVVPVSLSDTLTVFFQAEGTLNETAIPTVTKALETLHLSFDEEEDAAA